MPQSLTAVRGPDGPPSYVSTTNRIHRFDPRTGAYNLKAANTRQLHASLGRAITGGIAEWVLIGDSLMTGSTTSGGTFQWSYKWPTYMRDGLAVSGATVGGTGMIRALWDTQRWAYSANWLTGNVTNVYTITNGAAATFTPDIGGDRVTVYYWDDASGGTFTVSVNGATSGAGFTTVTQSGAAGWKKVTLSIAIIAGQTVVITKTNATGFLTISGAATWSSTGGLIIHNISEGSATAYNTGNGDKYAWGTSSADGSSLWTVYAAPTVSLTNPDVIFIGLGANDIDANATPAQVTTAITAVRNHYSAAEPILVLTQQLNNSTHVSDAEWEAYAAALYDLADTLDCPLIDFRARIGNYSTTVTNGLTVDGFGHFLPLANADLGSSVANLIGSGPTIEAVDDRMSTFLVPGAGLRRTYNDVVNTLTFSAADPLTPTAAGPSTIPRHAITGGGTLTSGQVRLSLIWLDANTVVSNITFAAGNVGGATMTHSVAGLYSSSQTAPVLLATSADNTTATWTGNTARTFAMTTPYTVPTAGFYYIAIFAVATTMPALAVANTGSSGALALAPIMSATSDTGRTTTLANPAATPTVTTNMLYAYVS